METYFATYTPYFIAIGISLSLIFAYYWVLKRIFRSPNTDPDSIQKTVPMSLSPGALRFLWKGEADWDLLITIAFSAVQKQVYRLRWNQQGKSVSFQLAQPNAFRSLAMEEQACLTMGRGTPLKGVVFNKQKKGMDEKMAFRVEQFLEKKYADYLTNVKKWMSIGLVANIGLVLLSAGVFAQPSITSLVIALVLMGFTLLGTILYFDRFLDESTNWKRWYFLARMVFLMAIFVLPDFAFGFPLISFVVLMLPIHMWMYMKLPRHSHSGLALATEIEAYRRYLHHHKPYMEEEDIAYCLALDIPCEEAEQFSTLLTTPWNSELPAMTIQQEIMLMRRYG